MCLVCVANCCMPSKSTESMETDRYDKNRIPLEQRKGEPVEIKDEFYKRKTRSLSGLSDNYHDRSIQLIQRLCNTCNPASLTREQKKSCPILCQYCEYACSKECALIFRSPILNIL